MTEESEKQMRHSAWKSGLMEAAQLLAIYPNAADYHARHILDLKRKEILRIAGVEDEPHQHCRRLGDGVLAEMTDSGVTDSGDLRLSVRHGDGSEDIITMSKATCDELMHYIRQNVFCNEEA